MVPVAKRPCITRKMVGQIRASLGSTEAPQSKRTCHR